MARGRSTRRGGRQALDQDTDLSTHSTTRMSTMLFPVLDQLKSGQITKWGECVITGLHEVQVCHIFPMLIKEKEPTDLTRSMPGHCNLLSLFFNNEHVLQWKDAILPNPDKPTNSISQNFFCLSNRIHNPGLKDCPVYVKNNINEERNGSFALYQCNTNILSRCA